MGASASQPTAEKVSSDERSPPGLALFAAWTLLSSVWSDAPGRALLEYDRVLLYLLALVVLGALTRSPLRLRWVVRGIAAGALIVCVASLITRLLPELWPTAASLATEHSRPTTRPLTSSRTTS